MASLDSVRQKIHRGKMLYDELWRELIAYYESDPGDLSESPESIPERRTLIFQARSPVPARLGLICGEVLQCLRSSLDYLVWELAEAANNPPHDRLMFPVCLTTKSYRSALDGRRLDGVIAEAAALIDSFQPFHVAKPEETALAMLD